MTTEPTPVSRRTVDDLGIGPSKDFADRMEDIQEVRPFIDNKGVAASVEALVTAPTPEETTKLLEIDLAKQTFATFSPPQGANIQGKLFSIKVIPDLNLQKPKVENETIDAFCKMINELDNNLAQINAARDKFQKG